MNLLRPELLQGRAIALAPGVSETVSSGLSGLGARVELLPENDVPVAESDGAEVGRWARERAPLHALVYDAAPDFGRGGPRALAETMERAWAAVRELAVGALIDAQDPGKAILIAPRPQAGPHAEPARAALENLSRTLSVEWARYQVTVVAVAPGTRTTESQLAELVCYLCSEAGAYLSGCRLELAG